jgi:hypothetical protein
VKQSNEQRYYDALKLITQYGQPDRLRRQSEREYGLSYEQALEFAYENVISEARFALGKRRRPRA